MESKYSIPLSNIISDFKLEEIYLPVSAGEIKISSPEVSRPGLALSGFVDVFEPFRIQIIGKAEHKYLSGLSIPQRAIRINAFFKMKPVAVVVTSNLQIYDDMLEAARAENIPLLRTEERTSPFMAALIALLNTSLAPRITRHGVLVEVYGEGVLILGDSGIGKSETAIELVKRGHRLIADDAVEIKRVSNQTLVGTAPDLIRYYIELRGIGIVDVRRLFGMGAVKATERIDLVIKLESWAPDKLYDRFGLDEETENILGIGVPAITIPVHHGRNLAVVIEIAAMNNRQKKMGYNTAEEFNKRLMEQIESEE
ncbi:MAG: HPr(Ser) kinase/phosphatase [Clostridia bacterium]|nr:HPr(Ser) kinase/phosphatase [Clostridia bacterium]MBR2850087.1 HPr(Ser) kinase/phosphatase [Clostridia bacterium]